MSAPIKQASFSGGEITPLLYGRTDHVKYETGLRTLRNRIAMRHGGVTRRPGTQYVFTTQNLGQPVRLIPFIFNETGLGQSYILEFGNNYVAFYQNGAVVINGGIPYKINSPYAQGDLSTLQFDQSADVITITHPNYPVYELKRLAATNWTLTTATFGATVVPGGLVTLAISGTAGTDPAVTYSVTPVLATGEECLAQQISTGSTLTLATPTTPVTITITLQTTPSIGIIYFKIYKAPGNTSVGVSSTGVPGYIGTVSDKVSGGLQFQFTFADTGFVPDFTNTPPLTNTPFSSANNYPSTVSYVQQRRAFANTINNPIGFWITQPGLFSNLNIRTIPLDSDAISGSIAGTEVNSIQHIVELKFLLMLTAGSELWFQGNGNGVLTPSTVNAVTQSQYGSSPLRPLKIQDTLLFNQALGSFVRDLNFDFSIDGYRGNDLTVFSSHLFENYQLLDWAYQKIPDSIVWAVRNDGVLLGLTYMREQQVLAWHRHDFINGLVENICAVPENGQYAVYLVINRTINGSVVRYLERMSSRLWTDVINATYLDCFLQYNGVNRASTTMTLTSPTGSFTQDGTAYQHQLTLKSSVGFFSPGMVGDSIFISDQPFEVNSGNMVNPNVVNSGYALSETENILRCIIISYQSSTQVTVMPNKIVPPTIGNQPLTTWAHAVNKVTGLNHLIGQQVAVYADRFVVGSPLNSQIQTTYTVANDGSLQLDKNYAVIYVGLPMVSDLETLDIETSFGETLIAKRKRQMVLKMNIYQTRSLWSGSENPDTNDDNVKNDPLFQLYELKSGTPRDNYDQSPTLRTDQDYIIEDSRYNKNGRIFIREVDPLPSTILAIVPGGDYSSTTDSPYYTKT